MSSRKGIEGLSPKMGGIEVGYLPISTYLLACMKLRLVRSSRDVFEARLPSETEGNVRVRGHTSLLISIASKRSHAQERRVMVQPDMSPKPGSQGNHLPSENEMRTWLEVKSAEI